MHLHKYAEILDSAELYWNESKATARMRSSFTFAMSPSSTSLPPRRTAAVVAVLDAATRRQLRIWRGQVWSVLHGRRSRVSVHVASAAWSMRPRTSVQMMYLSSGASRTLADGQLLVVKVSCSVHVVTLPCTKVFTFSGATLHGIESYLNTQGTLRWCSFPDVDGLN